MTGRSTPVVVSRAVAGIRDRLRWPPLAGSQAWPADATLLRRVRWQLVAWSAGLTLLLLALLGPALYGAVASSLGASGRQQLEIRAAEIGDFIEHNPFLADRRRFGGGRPSPPLELSLRGPAPGTFGYIVGPGGASFGPQNVPTGGLPDDRGLSAARTNGRDLREISVEDVPLRVLTDTVDAGPNTWLVQVVQDTTGEHRALGVLLAVLVGGGLAGVAGAALLGAIYAGRALVPIRESLRRQREFAADASHELRTPLTVIRSSVDYLERHKDRSIASATDTLSEIREEVDRLSALVSDLLLLARTDSGVVELERLPVDLGDVAAEALAPLSTLAATRGVRLVLDPEPASVIGDAARLRQLVTILVDNAIGHSPLGGAVTARVRSTRDAVELTVEDDGPGLAPEDLAHVFDRFWRGPGAPEGGTGLGLAIASWIVERHGGRIAAANRATGGASFAVTLPAEVATLPAAG